MSVRRITRHGHCDAIASLEQGEKRQHKSGRGAGRDDDALGIEFATVPLRIGLRDTLAQRGNSQRGGIAMGAGVECSTHGGDSSRRGAGRRLPDFHVHNGAALRLQPRRRRHHVHHHERRHVAADRRPQQSFCPFQHEAWSIPYLIDRLTPR